MITEKQKKSGLKRCVGHWPIYLRHSRVKKKLNKEKERVKDVYDEDGKCCICGGYWYD